VIADEVGRSPQSAARTPRHTAAPANPEWESQRVSYRISTWPVLGALIAILLLGVGASQMGVGRALLKNAGLIGSSDTYTSLAFLKPQSLPTQIGSRGATVNVAFVIHNVTTSSRNYQWDLLLLQDQHDRGVSSGEIRVQPGREISINKTIKVFCRKGEVRITVSLARPAEHIDEWMTCKA
jgi:hypothetical protein